MPLPPRPVPPLLLSLPCVTAPSVFKRAGAVVSSLIQVVQSRPSCDPPNGGARGGSKGDERGANGQAARVEHKPEAKAEPIEKAAGLWGKAGQRSLSRSALLEAVEQLKRAIDQIAALPGSPALRR